MKYNGNSNKTRVCKSLRDYLQVDFFKWLGDLKIAFLKPCVYCNEYTQACVYIREYVRVYVCVCVLIVKPIFFIVVGFRNSI